MGKREGRREGGGVRKLERCGCFGTAILPVLLINRTGIYVLRGDARKGVVHNRNNVPRRALICFLGWWRAGKSHATDILPEDAPSGAQRILRDAD